MTISPTSNNPAAARRETAVQAEVARPEAERRQPASRLQRGTIDVAAVPPRPPAEPLRADGLPPNAALRTENSLGRLAPTFGQSVTPAFREIVGGLQDGTLSLGRFSTRNVRGESPERFIEGLLRQHGRNEGNVDAAARHVLELSRMLDVQPAQFLHRLDEAVRAQGQLVARVDPQHPLLIDGSQPQTTKKAVDYFSALLAQGVKIPKEEVEVQVEDPRFGGTWKGTISPPGLHTTAMNSDIDGPFAASYGQQGVDVTIPGAHDTVSRLHLQLPEAVAGVPTRVRLHEGQGAGQPPAAVVSFTTPDNRTKEHVVEVSSEQAQMLRAADPAKTQLNYVEGLSARLFSPASVDFWQQVSDRIGRGGEFAGNVKAPSIVFNTFGSHGTTAFANPQELVTSFARSLPPRQLPKDVQPGIFDAPNVRVYSGGTTLNEKGTATPVGLSPAQQASLQKVADALDGLVAGYAQKYKLSADAAKAWQGSNFSNPDIPSVLIPNKVIQEMAARTQADHDGLTFADMQEEIENDVSALIRNNAMEGFISLHHTPSAAGDQLLKMKPGGAGEFTTEWQFAVKGQKAMPVLDAVSNDLQRNFGIDLKAALEEKGLSYARLREMSLEDTIQVFSAVVSEAIREKADGRQVMPHVIVPVDTYYEKNGQLGGSDASLVGSAAALYTPEKTCVVLVDTGGGKETPGRAPMFRIAADREAGARLDRITDGGKGPVDPHGPNAALAPRVFARSAADMGEVFSQAYRNQSPLEADDLLAARNRQNRASDGA